MIRGVKMAVKIIGSRKNRISLSAFIMVIIAGVMLFLAAGFLGFKHYKQMEKEYETAISSYEEEIHDYQSTIKRNTKIAYIPLEDLKYNTVIEEHMFEKVEVFSSVSQEDFIDENDLGKVINLETPAGSPVLKHMVEEQLPANDLRNVEFSTFMLQSNIVKNDFIDVRIRFPNGEDYIVLSKKKIEDVRLQTSTIWLNIKHSELMTMSSAIVDAYLKDGTKLYVVKYVSAQTQDRAQETYPVNENVRKIMKEDPNILEKALNVLSEQARDSLEERLINILGSHMEGAIKDEMSGLNSNVQETLKAEANNAKKIQEQESEEDVKRQGDSANQEKGSR